MSRLKRSRYFVVSLDDEPSVDLGALLRGRVDVAHETRIAATSALTESEHTLSRRELDLLRRVPAREWSPRSRLAAEDGAREETLDALVAKGLLISDADDPQARRLRRREERFEACQWHPGAAFYHLVTKHPDGLSRTGTQLVDVATVAADSRQTTDDFVARHGMPPPPFHEVPGDGESVRLPLVEREGGLYRALAGRKTVRAFDPSKPMRAQDLATLLYYVFGCHGHTRFSRVTLLRKTSPSGGSLHPVEVYPLVLDVAGVATGLYHYRVRDHSLARLREMEHWEAEALAVGMAAGQDFAASAHVLLLMTARFDRNFWKYRRNARTHSVVLQDAGHLSQTLYLVCSDLRLGVFYAAFDAFFVEEALGLDGIEEGVVGLAGCGEMLAGGLDHSLVFDPYTPGETEV